jgi:hypothetical protein
MAAARRRRSSEEKEIDGGGGARTRKKGNGEHTLKLPYRQWLPRDEAHARFGGQTCFSAGLVRVNAHVGKNICRPHADTESRYFSVSTENCILVVIISTNNIAIGMVRGRRKYDFNPPKIRFPHLIYFRF